MKVSPFHLLTLDTGGDFRALRETGLLDNGGDKLWNENGDQFKSGPSLFQRGNSFDHHRVFMLLAE